jgi:hypothetical protein
MSINTLAVEGAANSGAIPQPPSRGDVIAGLTKYIPTESITLLVLNKCVLVNQSRQSPSTIESRVLC